MSLTYMVLVKPGTEPMPFEYYAALACMTSGNQGVGKETVLGSTLQAVEQAYVPVLDKIEIQSINSESFHSDDLFVIMHGFYPDAGELMFDIAIDDMPQPWRTIFSMLTDWTILAGIDLQLGELTYIRHDQVVMQVIGLAPAIRKAITNIGLGVVK